MSPHIKELRKMVIPNDQISTLRYTIFNIHLHLHLHLQDTKQCLDRPLRFGNTSAQRRERLEIKL